MSDNCGNPLLRDWVKEWMDQASSLQSKSYYTYKKAYESLCKCPVEFSHPSEAERLNGIGPGLVNRLTKSLAAYCKEKGLAMPEIPGKAKKRANTENDDSENAPTPVKKRVAKPYVPAYRTGGYGIMLCLLEYHSIGLENIVKDQICRTAQKDCDASYTLAEPGRSYTAWSSMKTLLDKGYVWKNGSPVKYCLTDTGLELAKHMKSTSLSGVSNGNGSGISSPSRATAGSSGNANDASSMLKNVSTARGKKARSTSDILNSMIDFDAPDELDMSLYVSNPSEHQSISINGKTSTNNTAASRSNDIPSEDILQALADASRPKKRQRATGTKATSKRQKKTNKSTTAAYLDDLLTSYDNQSSELDMSMYVTNPSEHQSISLGGRTIRSTPTNPASSTSNSTPKSNGSSTSKGPSRPGSASSFTNSNNSSFAKRVMSASDNNDYDDWDYGSPSSSRYSTSASSTILQADKARKYTTPSSSVLLKNNKPNVNKPAYNVDEYEIDLTPLSLPTFKQSTASSQRNINSDDIVDLLSSPSPSPTLQSTAIEDDFTFDADFDPEKDYFPISQSRAKQINEETFHYTYLDTERKEARHLSKAAIHVAEADQCLAYHIRFFTSQSNHPKFKHLVQVTEDEDHPGCSTGYITEMHKDAISPGLPAKPILPLHREEPDEFWPNKEVSSSQTFLRNDYNERLFSSQASSQPSSSSQPFISSQPILSQPISSQQTQTQQNEVNYTQLIKNEPLEFMLPHEYEIILVLDSREIQMKGDRDYFQRKLAEKGVKYTTRSMDLGDVIWVAQRKGNTNQSEELFLDYIVERKRLDDLVSSIKDGRFVEQKTRLKRSGAAKVIYVVEEYNREDAINFGLQAIQTAMCSTQIIDGIYLKRTNNVDDTIEYLVSATKLVERIYKDTTLYQIPGHIITRQNYLDLKAAYNEKAKSDSMEKSAYLVTYPMYGQLNTKNGSSTLHEIYLRMLMTIRGVNAERALSLIKIYPTPYALLKAFAGKTVEEAKTLVKDATQHHISRRRWGVQISERLFQIWGAAKYPPPAEEEDYLL